MKLLVKRIKRGFYSIFIDNFLLKLLSLMTAVILWLGVTSSIKMKYQFYSYVDVVNIPEDMQIVKIRPEKVKIIIEGKTKIFSRYDFEKVSVYVDGKKLKEGKNQLKVNVFAEGLQKDDLIIVEPESVIIYAKKSNDKEVYQ